VIVTGKGGTGKTTVVAALAVAAAGAGRRVLVAEMGRDEQIHRLLAPDSPPCGYLGRELVPGVRGMRIDPFEALAEYLGLQLGVRSVIDRVVRNKAFRQLLTATPGWRELITLGKIWHLEQETGPDGRPLHDLIVVDAPATGHGVTFLDVPRVVVSTVRAGPLRHHTERVEAMLADPERTLLLPVALGEELPMRETIDLVERVREGVGIALDRIVVNGVFPRPFPAGLDELDVALGRLPADARLEGIPGPGALAACARHLRARYELNRAYVEEIAVRTALPIVCLPYLTDGVSGLADIDALAGALLDEPREKLA
jgi:anion-transporting  ArsA/GET3 family ATPase